MALALALAGRGLGRVWPNPAVGCVIERDGRILGRGWTQPGGRPHAEAVALAEAGPMARGATAHVSLEPCAHHGATPPCAAALVAAGVAHVVSALEDPDPRVAGRGHALIAAARVGLTTGVMAAEAARLNAGFLMHRRLGRPLVTLKLAASLDGRIATSAGESRWITGPAARARVHLMRARHDAVLVGGGTARADDPALTVRGLGTGWQPVRAVATRSLDLPADGALAAGLALAPLWLLHDPAATPAARAAAWTARGARLLAVAAGGTGGLDPPAMLAVLGAAGLTRVLCEGGGQLAAALLAAGLVDRISLFSAGLALGADGRPALGGLGLAALAAAPRFRLTGVERLGPDLMSEWERAEAA
ncbi:MAG: bifunctional diaminohydroxyphosphoribosylaminopyrimidine deaminase/5-amino-6-(5-phosphoribosylamino)uracil reductase RibD [Rhodobacteraceae bacterium]|nr:bifunctional diaminohydroxyphosphoribosylaminopyrimidine deaminase/5-amino-6-(5-phosphoribosylamino)uracil reductase RibD [Paracoccaceae bacterium]